MAIFYEGDITELSTLCLLNPTDYGLEVKQKRTDDDGEDSWITVGWLDSTDPEIELEAGTYAVVGSCQGLEFEFEVKPYDPCSDAESVNLCNVEAVAAAIGLSVSTPLIAALTDQTSALQTALEAQTLSLGAQLQALCDKLDAGITVNAVQSGVWEVAADLSTADLEELTELLSDATLQVNVAGQDTPLDVTLTQDPLAVSVDFAPLIAAIEAQVTVDYETLPYCIMNGGERVPSTGVYLRTATDYFGNVITEQVVTSIMSPAGVWTAYTLGAGDTIVDCPVEAPTSHSTEATYTYASGSTTVPAGVHEISVTFFEDGTINGQTAPAGFTWNYDAGISTQAHVFTGTAYGITVTQEV